MVPALFLQDRICHYNPEIRAILLKSLMVTRFKTEPSGSRTLQIIQV